MPEHDHDVLVEVLTYHWRSDSNVKACGCGWAELGRSHPEHVVQVYEDCLRVAADEVRTTPHCAGRSAVAHHRTAMSLAAAGWVCPVCGETDECEVA